MFDEKLNNLGNLVDFLEKHPEVSLKDYPTTELRRIHTEFKKLLDSIKESEDKIYDEKKKRDSKGDLISELIVRIHNLVIANFGRDSAEVNAVGLVAKSDRKKPTRDPEKVKARKEKKAKEKEAIKKAKEEANKDW